MRRRLGVAVSRTAIRAVAVERGRVTWAAERLLGGTADLAPALAELAAERPRGVRTTRVALDGELVQVKLLQGFPRVSGAKLGRAVALQAARWFLKNGRPLVTGAARLPGGVVLAAATEQGVLDAVTAGMAEAGLALAEAGAGLGACAPLLPDGEHALVADDLVDCVSVADHHILALRRGRGDARPPRREAQAATSLADPIRSAPSAADRSLTVPGLEGGERFFTAYAAALHAPAPRFDRRSDTERQAGWRRLGLRLAVAGAVLWTAAGVVFGARVRTATRQAAIERAALGPALDAAVAVERDLALTNEVLRAVDAARHARSRDARLLSVLTAALPDSAHLLALRRSRDGQVTLVGYAPVAARVLAALAGAPGIIHPALQSGITRETVVGRSRERFAIAFTWRPAAGAP